MENDFQSKTGRSALPASFSSFDQMPLRSRPTRARDTPDARSLLEEEVTEETRARPLFDARTFLETEAQEETGITPKSGTEETEEDWGFEQITNEEPVVLDVKTEPGEPQPDIEQLTNGPFVPVVKTEPGEPHSAAVGDEAPAQPAVVNLATQAVIALVGRLADRGLFVHDGAVPTIRELEHTSAKKDRSKGKVVWHNDNLNVDLAQIALFVKVVNPLDGATAKELPWRLGPSNPTIKFTLDATGGTTYDFKYNHSVKCMLRDGLPMFDPNCNYSLTNTINFIKHVDRQTQAQAGTVCSAIVADFKRLHQNKTDVTFNQYVDLARAGDKVLHEGAISTPHTIIIHAFCNPPWLSTPVHTSKCPCSEWLQLRRHTQPCCGSWQGRFAKFREVQSVPFPLQGGGPQAEPRHPARFQGDHGRRLAEVHDRGDPRLDYRAIRRGARIAHCGPLRAHLCAELLLA